MDARVTAYYLWLPSLLVVLFGLARLPRMLWRRYLERGVLKALLAKKDSAAAIATAFIEWRPRFSRYQRDYALCEALNLVAVVVSASITNGLLRRKFFAYGPEVMAYYLSGTTAAAATAVDHYQPQQQQHYYHQPQQLHDPMCELFPTEVACHIQVRKYIIISMNNNIKKGGVINL